MEKRVNSGGKHWKWAISEGEGAAGDVRHEMSRLPSNTIYCATWLKRSPESIV